ncbi:hypothetical protein [Hoeflea sp.]|uniref:hypothetical protein n=1 Tax=Hoeflea sp. TaxID=1940281 RepID=UPI0019B913EB|nr:hypothetical protein [Hoeflea sp.]MBC7284538.1 adenosine deaminase [Hoeflea sp.]
MIDESVDDLFRLQARAAIAKAIFSNLELIAHLEGGAAGQPAEKHLMGLFGTGEGRSALSSTYFTGRFLRFRKLYPHLTDEALEHRISWALAGIHEQGFASQRTNLDDPARCLAPLLTRLAETFLCEARDGSLRVKSRFLAEWQDLILVVPPMLITATWMAVQPDKPEESISEYLRFQTRVQAWLCDSTLPVDDDPLLDQLCKVEGLDESHMHLNGTTEAEKVWVDALRRPNKVVGAVSGAIEREDGLQVSIGNGVNRLLRQEDPALTPRLLRSRVEQAISLKSFLLEHFTARPSKISVSDLGLEERYASAVRSRTAESGVSATVAEALQLIDIISGLTEGRGQDVHGIAFLWYALVRAQFCRLLVQQVEQTGFDQFQHITFNELRETTEKDFAERFRQIERGSQHPVDFLEGRFAPKTTPRGTSDRLMQILRGYLQFLDETPEGKARGALSSIFSDVHTSHTSLSEVLELVRAFENGKAGVSRSQRRLRLGLVAHFIKRTDPAERERFLDGAHMRPVCRDSKARREADQSARALVVLMKKTTGLSEMIRGVDAASNERHAGPEVFAQVFRRMRRAGIHRFTYHVGEDFVHIASGLRAMNEAVRFLDLSAGCRIGHGTAAGLEPEKWWSSVAGSVIQPLEDRLDDLVFAWGTLADKCVMLDKLPLFDLEIRRLAMQIWQDPAVTPDLLLRAWQLRHLDPIVSTYGDYDVDPDRNAEIQLFRDSRRQEPDAHEHFLRRHGVNISEDALRRSREPILITQDRDILSPEVLKALQSTTLELLQERLIAIETLPSSNVRISIHQCYEEHHASSWLGYGRSVCPPSVVIGSDDPGIFATSLRMEYAHLLRALKANGAGSEAVSTLESLIRTSKRFRF